MKHMHLRKSASSTSSAGKKGGFTLIELLVVISIIGMLSSVILVALQSARDKGVIAAAQEFASTNYHALGANALVSYSFNEASGNALDSSGNNITLTPTACPGSCRTNVGTPDGSNALLLNGTSQYFSNSASVFPNVNLTNFTVSFWINPVNIPASGFYSVFALLDSSGSRIAYADVRPGGLLVQGIGFSCYLNTPITITPAKWQQVTYVQNGATLTVYINGKSLGSLPVGTCGGSDTPTQLLVGNFGGFFNGQIDDLDIYTQTLSDAQVENIYATQLPVHVFAFK